VAIQPEMIRPETDDVAQAAQELAHGLLTELIGTRAQVRAAERLLERLAMRLAEADDMDQAAETGAPQGESTLTETGSPAGLEDTSRDPVSSTGDAGPGEEVAGTSQGPS
jgi:hypothetical protein